MKIQESIDSHIRSALFAMRRMYNLLAAEKGTTQGVAYVLLNVPQQGVAATRIAPMMGMGITSLSRLLKTMEDDELIYRVKDKDDKRVVHIFLTETGVALRKKVRQVVIDFNKKGESVITEEEMKIFTKVCLAIKTEAANEVQRLTGVADNDSSALLHP